MDLVGFSASRDTSVGSSEWFGGLSRKFLSTYILKISITRISSGGNNPQHLTAPEIAMKILENPEIFRFSAYNQHRANSNVYGFGRMFRTFSEPRPAP